MMRPISHRPRLLRIAVAVCARDGPTHRRWLAAGHGLRTGYGQSAVRGECLGLRGEEARLNAVVCLSGGAV